MSSKTNVKPMHGGSTKPKPMKGGNMTIKAPTIKAPQSLKSTYTKTTTPDITMTMSMSGGTKKKSKKSSKSKSKMPEDHAYCLNPKCRKQVKMLTHKERKTKNGRKQLVGKGECGHDVYRFI